MKIIEVLKKIQWVAQEKNTIVLFDAINRNILDKTLLKGISYTPIFTRFEIFPISFGLLWYFLLSLKYFSFQKLFRDKKLLGQFYTIFFIAWIRVTKAKFIVTNIHNNTLFYTLSRMMTDIRFIAIQNGRMLETKGSILDREGKVIPVHLKEFFCFGEYEVDTYRKLGFEVKKFYPCGSVTGGYYKKFISDKNPKTKYDLCIVSVYRNSIMNQSSTHPEIRDSFDMLCHFTNRYIVESKNSLQVVIAGALKNSEKGEEKYFRSIFGESPEFMSNEIENFSTYRAVDESEVILTLGSAAALESFGWGKKVLFCNYTNNPAWDMVEKGIWETNVPDYAVFKKKLDFLLNSTQEDYHKNAEKFSKYMMHFREKTVSEYLNEILEGKEVVLEDIR